jgi:WhiB family transcriptional regulator, redox-sensing transcriptional regulator
MDALVALLVTAAPHATLDVVVGFDEDWRRDAACAGHPLGTFFPVRGESGADAKTVCVGCVVRLDCLRYALADRDLVGVWGGTTGLERRDLRRQFPRGLPDGYTPPMRIVTVEVKRAQMSRARRAATSA